MTFALNGIGASKGIAIGRIRLLERGRAEVAERAIAPEEVNDEVGRFRRAVRRARTELERLGRRVASGDATDVSAFIDTHLLMLQDASITSAPVRIIRERRCNAEWALKLQRDALVSVFDAMEDAYLRSRRDDVDHVVDRVQRILLGTEGEASARAKRLAGRVVLVDDLTPADTLLMQHQGVVAFVTQYGGPNSHAAILARSLRIPAVVGLHDGFRLLADDELVVVDGRQGVVMASPKPAVLRHFRARRLEIARIRSTRSRLRRAPAVTRDGEAVHLHANVELPADALTARKEGATGVGLYRTEYLFMNRAVPPDEEEQYAAYCEMISVLRGAPITIRTLDIGADKQLDGAKAAAPATLNPALGLRAIRLCLKEQNLFLPQLRAILRASARGPVRLMLPMISGVAELMQTLEMIQRCRGELVARGQPFDPSLPIGVMIEVPAAAICADLFARHVDFMSIGTNDLIQYTIAIDRVDDEVNYLYDPLHPAVLRLVSGTIEAGRKAGIPVAMCGEMAGDARYTRLLLGLGLQEFSVHPGALLEVKQAIVECDTHEARRLARRLVRAGRVETRDAVLEALNRGMAA